MKRLLSLILAVAMVLSLIPVMYASAETGTNDVVIDFDECTAANPAVPLSSVFSFNQMGLGNIEWRRDSAATGGTLRVRLVSSRLWPSSPTARIAAINVEIPADGYYSIKFKGGLSKVSGNAAVFMDSTCTSNQYSGGTYLGDYDFTSTDASTSTSKSVEGEEKTLNTVYLTKDTHTIMFLLRDADSTLAETFLFFKKLSFIYQGTVAPTVASLDATVPAQTMGVGETHALTADVTMSDGSILYLADYNSDGSENTADRVKVTSSAPEIVNVTSVTKGAEGNAEHTASYSIEAVAEGNATLTYTLYQNNTQVGDAITKEVTVGAAGSNDVICDFDALATEYNIIGTGNLNNPTLGEENLAKYNLPFSIKTVMSNSDVIGWSNVATNTANNTLRATISAGRLWPSYNVERNAMIYVKIPADGYYKVKFQGGLNTYSPRAAIFIDADWDTTNSRHMGGKYLGDYDFSTTDETYGKSGALTTSKPGNEKVLNTVYLKKGTHSVVFLHSEYKNTTDEIYLFFKKLSFIYEGTEEPTPKTLTTDVPAEALEVGDTEKLSASVTMSDGTLVYLSEYLSSAKHISNIIGEDTVNKLTVTSKNPDIVAVSSVTKGGLCNSENTNYSIEAVAGGTTKLIYTLYRDGEKPVVVGEKSITVNPKKVKLMADKNGDGNVSGDELSDVTIGVETYVTAAKTDREFAYWTDADGGFVSELETYTFTPYTNTVLVAVYKNDATEEKIGVDFFDGNRDYLGFVSAESGTTFGDLQNKPTPSLIGYEFLKWSIEDNTAINGLLSAVAMYKEDENGYGKAITGNVTAPTETHTAPKYGQKITEENTSAKAWQRTIGGSDVTVGYGTSYTYYVWDETEIKAVTTNVTKAPLVVLDDVKDGAYMIEYDNGGLTALEAGIIFGDADSTVDSCYAKAKVREISNHGQFTAKPAAKSSDLQTYVRGYLIYKDANSVVKTIYTDAVAITAAE